MKKLLLSLFSIAVFFSAANHAYACQIVSADDGWFSVSSGAKALSLNGFSGDLIMDYAKAGNTEWRMKKQKTERWDVLFNRIKNGLGTLDYKSTSDSVVVNCGQDIFSGTGISNLEDVVIADSNNSELFYENDDVSDVADDSTAPVPEPATLFLLGSGILGLAGFGRKKQK
ncbi:MAG: PEP-CTERM sorting domain-containing protein [Desulfobacteraceae bacterium]|jgi:hypothetical protein